MAYRNKIYVAFDGDNDIRYYWLMKAWKQNDNIEFNFNDAHEMHQCRDTSTEETIKRSLKERMNNSKVFVLLIGEHTKYLYKFVKWEIEIALDMGLPIICVNLNGKNHKDDLCPPILNDKLAVFIPFGAKQLQHALENWPSWCTNHRLASGSYHYTF